MHCSPHGCIFVWYLSRVSPTLSGDYTAAAAIKSWPCVGEWAFATALFCGRQTWHRSHTPVTPDALFIHTPHGARTRPRSGRCTGDMWLHCACAIIFWRSTGSRKSPTRTAGSAHTVTETPRKMWGGNTIERGALGRWRGAHTWRGKPLVLFRFTIAMRFLESDGVTKSRRPHHTDCRTAHTPTRRGKTLLRDARRILVLCGVFSGRTGTRCL